MTDGADLAQRSTFAERLRIQMSARFPDLRVEIDPARYGLRLHGPGVERRIGLSHLHAAVVREPARAAALIADFVRASEAGLAPEENHLALGQLLWCVRSRSYLSLHSREQELLTRSLPGDLVGFVVEALPNATMRGVPRGEWSSDGEADVLAAADRNTAHLFERLPERIAATDRIPRDGWQLSSEVLFQGSVLLAPAVLEAFAARTGGDVMIGLPDRGVVLAVPAGDPDATEAFARRVRRTWREALNPCSATVVRTDGRALAEVAVHADRAGLLRRRRA